MGKTAGSFSEIDTNSFVQDQSKIKYAEIIELELIKNLKTSLDPH